MSEHSCDDALEELYHYLHGELTEQRRQQIRVHLDDCAPCLVAFDFEAELRVVISQRCQDTVSIELRERIAMAIGFVDNDD